VTDVDDLVHQSSTIVISTVIASGPVALVRIALRASPALNVCSAFGVSVRAVVVSDRGFDPAVTYSTSAAEPSSIWRSSEAVLVFVWPDTCVMVPSNGKDRRIGKVSLLSCPDRTTPSRS